MSLLSGKVVCITGSSRGIGRATAIEFAKHGATGLILHYLGDGTTEAEILSLKSEIEEIHSHARVVAVPGDIADAKTSVTVSALITVSLSLCRLGFQIVEEGVKAFGRIGS